MKTTLYVNWIFADLILRGDCEIYADKLDAREVKLVQEFMLSIANKEVNFLDDSSEYVNCDITGKFTGCYEIEISEAA